MAIITISVNDSLNKEFREIVRRKLGERKGALGKAIEEAIIDWLGEQKQGEIAERQINLAKRGLYSLKGWKFNREEAYER